MSLHDLDDDFASELRDGSRVKSDSRRPASDLYLNSDYNESDPELNTSGSSLSEAVRQMKFWTLEPKPAIHTMTDDVISLNDFSRFEHKSIESVLRCLESAVAYGTSAAIMAFMEKIDGLRWLARGNHSESKTIIWANSALGESHLKSYSAAQVATLRDFCQSNMVNTLRVLETLGTQLRREIEETLEAAAAAAYEDDHFQNSRVIGFVKERFFMDMRALIASKHTFGFGFWNSGGTIFKNTLAGKLIYWDEPNFANLLDGWLLAECRQQCKLLFDRCLSEIRLLRKQEVPAGSDTEEGISFADWDMNE